MKAPVFLALWAAASALSLNFLAGLFSETPDRVIKTGPETYRLASEADKLRLKRNGHKFIDVTGVLSVESALAQGIIAGAGNGDWTHVFAKQIDTLKRPVPAYKYPLAPRQHAVVQALVGRVDLERVRANLARFSGFYTRYYKSASGVKSADWLHARVCELVAPVAGAQVQKIKHRGWDQYSLVVSLPGAAADRVVVGAHQDSINLLFPSLMAAPGADDDGSGTVTSLEALRLVCGAIAAGEFAPHNTLEFHYYSAEEGGLLGSLDVFGRYADANTTVVGMLQQDMTGYTQGTRDGGVEPHFGLITDYTSTRQNDFIRMVAAAYCLIPVHETECGYACLDHAAALENGYPASFLIESEFKYSAKHIHLTMDTMDRLDFDHIREHIKLTVGYAVELAAAQDLY
ncbi:Zn-dependent exopeptidase [Metschnikowia bicuspidata var. bicuspidata NRRL YB-4993]|uniref:Peptide hydrolase n=1 Tax=Metschnikowia bicuspidata var. bicuspidata NRRL YB-4993 TaxID=869754 RepID=A0A1A0HAP0_9ASCO|nr:Zn-dependent exopeptidase [Metschnikowia bicuspidata var. bicuspidata NRRL YB-4993]OBA20948.1 Zn-dependent exopeptidase [Metschnikowia bicuspidata var. bicuspidata NRRL YB-4993]